MLLDDGVALREAGLRDRSSPAVVLPDVALWKASPTSVLDLAAAAVAEGGWLCVGFANRLFPGGRRGAMTLHTAQRRLRRAGLVVQRVYLPLPDHRHPALLVDAAGRAQLDHVFRTLFLTYLPGSSGPGSPVAPAPGSSPAVGRPGTTPGAGRPGARLPGAGHTVRRPRCLT